MIGTLVDKNNTFEEMFNGIEEIENIDNVDNILKYLSENEIINYEELTKKIESSKLTGQKVTMVNELEKGKFHKYFEIDIQSIKANKGNEYIGTLLLFKDITQHKLDMIELEEKQNIIVKQGQLVSIGELAGGVAHDINTPISAIKTGILMLNTMTNERTEQEKEIIFRMDNCATKIITIVNSMRNQIRNLGGDTNINFKISKILSDIKIITYHELCKNKTDIEINIIDDVEILGDPTKLGQVFTNLIVNAAQAYGEKTGGKIIITVENDVDEKNVLIKVIDFAGGIDAKISPFVFKNILTTKGIKGTGLGLYLMYSVIVGNFKGDVSFDTELGSGTTFYIKIPKTREDINKPLVNTTENNETKTLNNNIDTDSNVVNEI